MRDVRCAMCGSVAECEEDGGPPEPGIVYSATMAASWTSRGPCLVVGNSSSGSRAKVRVLVSWYLLRAVCGARYTVGGTCWVIVVVVVVWGGETGRGRIEGGEGRGARTCTYYMHST